MQRGHTQRATATPCAPATHSAFFVTRSRVLLLVGASAGRAGVMSEVVNAA